MSIEQHRISDFLQCELYHTIGSYRVAMEKLAALRERLASPDAAGAGSRPSTEPASRRERRGPMSTGAFGRLVEHTQVYNAQLHERRHATGWSTWAGGEPLIRHPQPRRLPLSKGDRFDLPLADPARRPAKLWVRPEACAWIDDFYAAAKNVLERSWKDAPAPGSDAHESYCFRQSLITWRNGFGSPLDERERASQRLHRYRHRLEDARRDLADGMPPIGEIPDKRVDEIVRRIAEDNLDTGAGSLSMFVLEALVEAHLGMHAVEACQSAALGLQAELAGPLKEGEWLDRELDRCIALDTFVYCAGRTSPWLFAEDLQECRQVFEDVSLAWQNVKPTRCIWIATQVSLLALHRRAYARLLKPGRAHKTGAYNDFHKLQGLIRDAERRVQLAPIHVEGALEFLAGLDAQAHYHTGELYRKEHAQRPARKHFQAAIHRLEQLGDGENTTAAMREVLVDSRWRVDLQMAYGKASYELGRHKESLCWHLRGWRAFLELLAADTGTEASTGAIGEAIAWLENVRYEPELRKVEVERNLTPVVEQLERIAVHRRLGGLAADILLLLGHLLFTLNVARKGVQRGSGDPGATVRERIERTLGLPCLRKALECDAHRTLVGADLLKVRARFREWSLAGKLFGEEADELPAAYDEALARPALAAVGEQWPGGGDDYEGLARVAEYLMLQAHAETAERRRFEWKDERKDYEAARRLLLNFFMHTDSINVRKSQVHRFLTRPPVEGEPPSAEPGAAIEFVCMRRYSSAFPLLPRPSAFRALGGGYFVRLHWIERGGPRRYGIVVDPGVDFVENMYRAGFSLGDVHMVIVTHDHVDHLGSLEPLLSLLYTRSEIIKEQSGGEGPDPIPVIASESVVARHEHVSKLPPFYQLRGLLNDQSLLVELGFPEGFGVCAMSSERIDTIGHKDLSDTPAYGVCFHGPRGISLAITSDTPTPPGRDDVEGRKRWREAWMPALEADVLVAHLSSVPLTELRKLAQLDAGAGTLREEETLRLRTVGERLEETVEQVLDASSERPGEETAELLRRLAASSCALVGQINAGEAAADLERPVADMERDAEALRAKLQEGEPQDRALVQFALEALAFAIELRRTPTDPLELERIRTRLVRSERNLQARLEFAMWLRSGGGEGPTADLVGRVPAAWESEQPHAFLQGVLRWAREYRKVRGERRPGLFVLGELSEELGSMRGKVATRLNETVLDPARRLREGDPPCEGDWPQQGDRPCEDDARFYALTSDIGMQLFVLPHAEVAGADAEQPGDARAGVRSPREEARLQADRVKVLCTNCSLDTDRATEERYHPFHKLFEVCVKGENEGIFYNCKEHDPSKQEQEVFLEQLERFDIFGH